MVNEGLLDVKVTESDLKKVGLESGFYFVGEFLSAEPPYSPSKNPEKVYYNVLFLVDDKTVSVGVDPITYGEFKTIPRMTKVLIKFNEFVFSNGGVKKEFLSMSVISD